MLNNDLAFWTNVVSLHYPVASCLHPGSPDGKSISLPPPSFIFPPSVLFLFLFSFSLILSLSVFLYLCRLINATTTRFAPCTQLHHIKFLSFILSSWTWWLRHCKTGCLPEYRIDYTSNTSNYIAWRGTSYTIKIGVSTFASYINMIIIAWYQDHQK